MMKWHRSTEWWSTTIRVQYRQVSCSDWMEAYDAGREILEAEIGDE
jgi:hypothetical protein